jgi:hypothetical protein
VGVSFFSIKELAGLIWQESPGTRVLVLDFTMGGAYQQVRILSGPHAGRSG